MENISNDVLTTKPLCFSTTSCALSSLFEAQKHDTRAYYTLDWDLHQIGVMRKFLNSQGLRVVSNNVYPGFEKEREEDFKNALQLLYQNRIEWWWNQRSNLIKYKICTNDEFIEKLR